MALRIIQNHPFPADPCCVPGGNRDYVPALGTLLRLRQGAVQRDSRARPRGYYREAARGSLWARLD